MRVDDTKEQVYFDEYPEQLENIVTTKRKYFIIGKKRNEETSQYFHMY